MGGYAVKILDMRLESLKDFEIGKPLFVGISSIHGSQIRYGLEFARRVRTLDSSIPLVWGGVHPTLLPEQTVASEFVDIVVRGEGEKTLLELADKFSAVKTYAKHRIQGAILDSLRDLDWSPRPLRKKARQLEQAHQRLRAQFGRPATEPELAIELGMELKELQHLLGDLRGLDLGSLQDEFTESGQERESLAAPTQGPDQEPYTQCLQGELRELLSRAVGELQPRERQVLSLYYFEELTMKEVGAVLGVGEARVSQIHSAALVRLRARMRSLLESSPSQLDSPPPTQTGAMETSWRRF